jgi:hypothetical protein
VGVVEHRGQEHLLRGPVRGELCTWEEGSCGHLPWILHCLPRLCSHVPLLHGHCMSSSFRNPQKWLKWVWVPSTQILSSCSLLVKMEGLLGCISKILTHCHADTFFARSTTSSSGLLFSCWACWCGGGALSEEGRLIPAPSVSIATKPQKMLQLTWNQMESHTNRKPLPTSAAQWGAHAPVCHFHLGVCFLYLYSFHEHTF